MTDEEQIINKIRVVIDKPDGELTDEDLASVKTYHFDGKIIKDGCNHTLHHVNEPLLTRWNGAGGPEDLSVQKHARSDGKTPVEGETEGDDDRNDSVKR